MYYILVLLFSFAINFSDFMVFCAQNIYRSPNQNLYTSSYLKDDPLIKIEQGWLRGCITKDVYKNDFYSFLGIPYAKRITRDLRFSDPQPAEKWQENVYDASKERDICIQRQFQPASIAGSDDCLYINVYTPSLKPRELLPVMVWIPGGAFQQETNSMNLYGPQILISRNIVLVSVNYRVNVLGFFRLNDTSLNVNGNQGLKDQAEALRWVQRNIANFGGDPNHVTLFGQSAGAGSTHFHLFSKRSKGLFHKLICQSGNSLTPWALSTEMPLEILFKGFEFNPDNVTSENVEKEFLNYLFSLNRDELINGIEKAENLPEYLNNLAIGDLPFSPVIERNYPEAFITENPEILIRKGDFYKVPTIIGFTRDEGASFLFIINKLIKLIKKDNRKLIPKRISNEISANNFISKKIANKIQKFYWRDKEITEKSENEFSKYLTDIMFGYDTIRAVRLQSKSQKNHVYVYNFKLQTKLNFNKQHNKFVGHSDDLSYLWYMEDNVRFYGNEEIKYINIMCDLWTNFVKYSNPNGLKNRINRKNVDQWIPVDPKKVDDQLYYLDISNESIKMSCNINQNRTLFWDYLHNTFLDI